MATTLGSTALVLDLGGKNADEIIERRRSGQCQDHLLELTYTFPW